MKQRVQRLDIPRQPTPSSKENYSIQVSRKHSKRSNSNETIDSKSSLQSSNFLINDSIQTRLDSIKRSVIEQGVRRVEQKLRIEGRCPICTLKPPCKHSEHSRRTSVLSNVSPKTSTQDSRIRFRSVNTSKSPKPYKQDLKETNKRLKKLQKIEEYKEKKLKQEIEKIEEEKRLHEEKQKLERIKEQKRKAYVEKQKQKLMEYRQQQPKKEQPRRPKKPKSRRLSKKSPKRTNDFSEKTKVLEGILQEQEQNLLKGPLRPKSNPRQITEDSLTILNV